MKKSVLILLALGAACSNSIQPPADGGLGQCATEATTPSLTKDDYAACRPCTFQPGQTCTEARSVDACCAYVQKPKATLTRSVGLVYNAAPAGQTDVDLGCLDTPKVLGTSQMVTIRGFIKLFASGEDSIGVKVELFQEGPNGTLGAPVGTPSITSDTSKFLDPKPTWSKKCPIDGCTLREFSIPNVPTETPLILKTSDATATQKWAQLYDYNVYFPNDEIKAGEIYYEPSAVAATDINTIAAVAGGYTIKPDKGVIAGEVRDCGNVRLSGATVNTDYRPEGDMFYFTENESDPTPDKTRTSQGIGTSRLGLFGALNYQTGVPVRVSAIGNDKTGAEVLVGVYTVQVFPGAITALAFRGRRPWQK